MVDYINLKYRPRPSDIICEYYMEPGPGMTYDKAASACALESSIGTWTTISTMNPSIAKKLKPSVYSIDKKRKIIKIAYHHSLFESGNMPGILSSIAGNIFGMKAVKNLKLLDIHFPKQIINAYRGPLLGIQGVRKLTKVKKRPFTGTIVKPKVGLNEKQHAKVAYEAWVGGLDIVKDDENLVSMSFNNFYKRVDETLKLRDKAERETGEKKIYLANITAPVEEMKKRADYVKKRGGEYIMVDILTVGFSALQTIREHTQKLKLAIHAHRAMHGAITRNPKHGISMMTIAKIARLIGVDTLHIGTAAVGKMHGSKDEELAIEEQIEHPEMYENDRTHVLEQKWFNIKPVLAVASGGLSPLSIPAVMKIMGNNIVMQAGGGVHGNPGGTRAGGAAMRQAVDATLKNISLKDYAKTHKELQLALNKWGKRK
ncbi:type III ribulose-bisphosphate carboxylase [Thermoproteota archaeon]